MRRTVLTRLATGVTGALAASAGLLGGPARGQTWPDKPITVIVPFPPGAVDGLARLVGARASALLGQPLVYRNVAGAGQRIGIEQVARAPKDGYTLGVITNSGFVVGPVLAARASYDPIQDFTAISRCTEAGYVLAVRADLGVRSVADLLARARARPGDLRVGSAGIGSAMHLLAEQMMAAARIQLNHVPYKGEAPMVTDLVGGQIDLAFTTTAGGRAHIDSGKLTALATSGTERSPAFEQLPTLRESGVQATSSAWLGFAAPAGIPAPVRDRLVAAFSQAARDPEVVAAIQRIGSVPKELSGEAFAAAVRQEVSELRELNKTLKLALD